MKIKHAVIVMAMLSSALLSQTGQQQSSQDSLLQRARNGDDSALSQMEKSGDMQDLRSLLHDQHYAGKSAVRLSLARMGDREALQYFACRSLTDDVKKMQLLIRDDLDRIGGAFTIEIYRQLLDSDSRFLPKVKRNSVHKYSDVIVALPSSMVLMSRPKLVSNPPVSNPRYLGDSSKDHIYKSVWKEWIKSHPEEIKKLSPSPEGISFDPEFCSQLDKKTHSGEAGSKSFLKTDTTFCGIRLGRTRTRTRQSPLRQAQRNAAQPVRWPWIEQRSRREQHGIRK
jgi:hypothetical protein